MEIYPVVDSNLIGQKIVITNGIACRPGWINIGDILTISWINKSGTKISFKERRKRNWKCNHNTIRKHFRLHGTYLLDYIDDINIDDIISRLTILEKHYEERT